MPAKKQRKSEFQNTLVDLFLLYWNYYKAKFMALLNLVFGNTEKYVVFWNIYLQNTFHSDAPYYKNKTLLFTIESIVSTSGGDM